MDKVVIKQIMPANGQAVVIWANSDKTNVLYKQLVGWALCEIEYDDGTSTTEVKGLVVDDCTNIEIAGRYSCGLLFYADSVSEAEDFCKRPDDYWLKQMVSNLKKTGNRCRDVHSAVLEAVAETEEKLCHSV